MAAILKSISAFLSSIILWFTGAVPGYQNTAKTLDSITKVNDYLYVMDCQYDYDLDEMVKRGQFNTVDLLLHNLGKLAIGEGCGFACTTFNSVNEDGDYIFSRNFDYMPGPAMLVWTHPDNGYASLGMLDLGLLQIYTNDFGPDDAFTSLLALVAPQACVDGINEKGVSIGVLEIEKDPTYQFTKKTNITTTGMVRLVLDRAANVDEAIEIFESYDMRDFLFGECTYHYQIADAYGNSAIIEYIDNEMIVIRPEEKEGAKVNYQVATNFILSYKNGVWDQENDPLGMGEDRYQIAMKALDDSNGVLNEKASMDVLEACSMYQADLHGYFCDTLWSSVYNTNDATLDLVVGLDYDNPLHFSVNEPGVIK